MVIDFLIRVLKAFIDEYLIIETSKYFELIDRN